MFRFASILCGGLLLGLLAPFATAQTPDVQPEIFRCDKSAGAALPRLIADLKSTDEKVRAKAIATLGAMGPIARPAAPALVEVAVNTRGHAAALQALAKIDDEATRTALRQLLVGRTGRCKCGNSFLAVVASAGEPVVPQLLVMLPEKELTRDIQSVLTQIGEPAVPHMIARLGEDKTPAPTRIAIYQSLAAMGSKAKSAVPTLEAGLRCDQGSTKLQRAHALLRIAGTHQAALNVLHVAVNSSDVAQKREALECLRSSGTKAKELIPTMLSFVIADDAQYHSDAMLTLVNIGPDAVEPLLDSITTDGCKRFKRLLLSKNPRHTERVLQTLNRMGPQAAEAIEIFIQLVEGDDVRLAIYAADALPNFGPEAQKAIPSLLAALKADSAPLCLSSANALVRIDRKQIPHTIEPIVKVVKDSSSKEQRRALWQLMNLGAEARPAVPELVALLKTEKLSFRVQIAEVLFRIDAKQHQAVMPTLIEALQTTANTTESQDRIDQALYLLEEMGPHAKSALPAVTTLLQTSLKSQDRNVYPGEIVRTLKAIDPSADVVALMMDGLNHSDKNRRREAANLVQRHGGPQALATLGAALENGTLQTSAEVTNLLKNLRPQATGAN